MNEKIEREKWAKCQQCQNVSNIEYLVECFVFTFFKYSTVASMTSAFSSNDADAIERNIDVVTDGQLIQEIWNEARCSECSTWITKNNFKRVNK